MGDDDCLVFASLGVRDGQLGGADQDAAFSLAKTAAEELKYDRHLQFYTPNDRYIHARSSVLPNYYGVA